MSVFGVFIICWCAGLVFFPTASIISTSEKPLFEKKEKPHVEKVAPPKKEAEPKLEASPVEKKTEVKKSEKKEEKTSQEKKIEKKADKTPVEKKVEKNQNKKAVQKTILPAGEIKETVFFNAYNGKKIFVLAEDMSKNSFIEHEGKTYLIYIDRVEGNTLFMGASEVP